VTAERAFTLLLVEDQDDNRELIRQVVERMELGLIEAVDGLSGVALAQQELPDLILMDLSLPGMSGWEATSLLKADPTTAGIPIIAITAHAMEGDEQRAKNAGCDAFVTKPIRLVPLRQLLTTYLAK
jgi:two-component system cell cycle response regulator DivK